MDGMGTMRDLDQIREQDDSDGSSRLMSLALGGLATACVLFAVGVMVGRESGESRTASREDPLTRLDHLAQQAEGAQAAITYPERLTGTPSTTAAAPTVPTANTPLPLPGATPALPGATPAAEGPVLLGGPATPSTGLRLAATGFGAPAPGTAPVQGLTGPIGMPAATGEAPVQAGSDGAFTVQVSSFRSQAAAQAFAQRLRERGHHAFVAQPATAPNGVVWHRVRIGPFTTQREAGTYRATFEARERMPTLIVRRDQEMLRPVQAVVRAPSLH